MKKFKKLLFWAIVLFLILQCTHLISFASEAENAGGMESVYAVSQTSSSEYGYIDYCFVDENGNVVDIESSVQSGATAINPLSDTSVGDVVIPSKYSLKDCNLVADVRSQGSSSSCWAFSSLGAIESNALMQGKGSADKTDFSEAHLVWFAQNSATADVNSLAYGDGITRSDPYNRTGNWMLSVSALSRWSGTVNETDYPFYPYEFNKMGNYAESERRNTSGGVVLDSAETLSSLEEIKLWIMQKGAVEAVFHYDEKYLNKGDFGCNYYCNDSSLIDNHAILIVGWDDKYSKSYFGSSAKPTYPGAFLCKNSWSSKWGDEGYFWVSYFDATIGNMMGYTCVDSDSYDNNYTYNGLGYSGAYKNTSANGSQIANVFASEGFEKLSAVSTYTIQPDTYIEIFIYKNLPEGYSSPIQGNLAFSSSKTLISNPGYHTISINKPVNLNPDEIFSVVIRLSNSSNLLYVVGEYNSGATALYSSKPGQSFIDTSGTNSNWYDSLSYGWNNNCIQAFTVCDHQLYAVTTPAACETEGSVVAYCSQCGEELSSHSVAATGHAFGEWKKTKAATRVSEGEKMRACETCGKAEIKIIPCLPDSGAKTVNASGFIEILKMWLDNFIAQVQNRYAEKGFRSY